MTGGSAADIINTGSLTSLTGDIDGGAGANKLVTGANLDISGANSFANIQTIEIGGDFSLAVTRAQLDAITITEVGGSNGSSINISSDGSSANKFELSASASLDISASAVSIGFLDGADPSAVNALELGNGSTLKLTAAQAVTGPLTISEAGGATATIVVEELESTTSADLSNITVTNFTSEVAVSGSVSLTGDLNDSALKITAADTTPVLTLTSAGSVDSVDFNNLSGIEVIMSTTQYTENDGLSVSGTTNAQTLQLVNSTSGADTVTQLSGIETYKLNATTAADSITFNALESAGSVNLTRMGHADAVVKVSVDNTATFDGSWTNFNAGDTLEISGVTGTVDVTGVNSGSTIGGIDTLTVGTGGILKANAAQLDGAASTGDGTTFVVSLGSSTDDLSSINTTSVTLDVTSANASVSDGFTLAGGRAYTVNGGNTLNLTSASSLGLNATSSFVIAASTGLIANASDFDQVATSSGGTTTVRGVNTSTADLSELNSTNVVIDIESANAAVGTGFDLAGRAYSVIGTGELDLTSASTVSTSASYALGTGIDLKINAADVTGVTITDTGSDSTVTVVGLQNQTDADLGGVGASSISATVVVANTVTLTGDLNGADLVVSSVSGTPVLNLTSAGTIGSIDFGNNAMKVIVSEAQYSALTGISNLTGSQTIQIVDATNDAGSDASVAQLAGIETYEINPNGANDNITFTTLSGGESVNLTRAGSTDALVKITLGQSASYDGTWSSFASGDEILVSGSSSANVEGVNSGASLGGISTAVVGNGSSLTAKAAQLSGATITGNGSVSVSALDDTANTDLGSIGASGGLTASVSLAEGETVSFIGDLGSAAVTISTAGDGTDEIFNVDGATMGTATFTVNSGATLQGTAVKLTGVTAAGDGIVAVTALHATPNADLSGIDATTTTAAFDGTATFTGTLDGAVVTVGDTFTMTAAANKVAGETINKTGTGKLAVEVGTADAAVDLSSIGGDALTSVTVTQSISFTGTLDDTVSTSIDNGVTLTIAAAKVTGKTVTGDGSIIVTGIEDTTDLQNVNPNGGVTASIAHGADISGSTKLANVDNFTFVTDADATMSLTQHSNITAAAGDNKVTLSANGTITANSAVEEYVLASGANNFILANVDQTVTGNSGADEITGGSGDDTIIGGSGGDTLLGGTGDDRITGGADEDSITGGGGADTFVFASGASGNLTTTKDTILDFDDSVDTLEFDITTSDAVDYAEVDGGTGGVRMFGDEFLTYANTAFAGGKNVYFAADVAATGNGYLAVDINGNGAFNAGVDTFIELTGLASVDDLSAANITFV